MIALATVSSTVPTKSTYQLHDTITMPLHTNYHWSEIPPSVPPLIHRYTTTIVPPTRTNDFFLRPPRSPFKKLFLGTRLREVLQAMSFVKSVPEGLKLSECERGVGGKNSPIRYIPESDPIQEALEKKKKVNTSS